MLAQQSILIVEDDPYLALDLQQSIEENDGRVVGPTRKLVEATQMVESEKVTAAIVDCHVADEDMLPLADLLARSGIPFILYAAAHRPRPSWGRHGLVPVLIKPLQPRVVLARLVIEMRKTARAR